MTVPCERTRAVIRAREFLYRIATPYAGGVKGIRKEVRQEARAILRHYPFWFDLGRADAFDVASATEYGLESDEAWLRSIDVARGTTQRTAAEPRKTSSEQAPQEPAKPDTSWMDGPVLVDPPSGWRYGFPKLWDRQGDMLAWLVREGYPAKAAKPGLTCRFIQPPTDIPTV